MPNEESIKWLERNNKNLLRQIERINEKINNYESEKKDILYNIKENENLIRQLQQ